MMRTDFGFSHLPQSGRSSYINSSNMSLSESLKNLRKHNPVLCVRRQDLVSFIAMEPTNLGGRHPKRSPACPSDANAPVASRLVDVD